MKPKVIIWGADNYNALGLLRQLSVADFEVVFLMNGKSASCATKSKYCKSLIKTASYKEGLDYLLKTADSLSKSVLIPTGDRAAEMIDRNKSSLSVGYYLMGTSQAGLLEKIDNKNEMAGLAEQCGFLVPKSVRINSSISPNDISFPCIIKPASDEGISKFKTKIIKSEKALKGFWKYLNPSYDYILQEFIPKTHDILVYGCRLNNGEIKLAGQFIKDRWSDDGGGSHGFLTNELPEYIQQEAIQRFLSKIDYRGLFSVEYGLVGKKAYFYEFNLRNDGTSHLFYQAGANLPLSWVYDCLGINSPCSEIITNPGWNINEIYDIANFFHGRISYKKYKEDRRAASIFHFYSSDDLGPWKYTRRKAIWDLPFRAVLKSFRPQIVWLLNKFGR